jgi:hypothetical protein
MIQVEAAGDRCRPHIKLDSQTELFPVLPTSCWIECILILVSTRLSGYCSKKEPT